LTHSSGEEKKAVEPENWVIIGKYNFVQEADLHAAILGTEGIECLIEDEHTMAWNPLSVIAFGGINLKVCREDAERAAELLKASDLSSLSPSSES